MKEQLPPPSNNVTYIEIEPPARTSSKYFPAVSSLPDSFIDCLLSGVECCGVTKLTGGSEKVQSRYVVVIFTNTPQLPLSVSGEICPVVEGGDRAGA